MAKRFDRAHSVWKIGRIVIDLVTADTIREDCPDRLDGKGFVPGRALRLGKIIQQKLPGADVVYTRPDDTFVSVGRAHTHRE